MDLCHFITSELSSPSPVTWLRTFVVISKIRILQGFLLFWGITKFKIFTFLCVPCKCSVCVCVCVHFPTMHEEFIRQFVDLFSFHYMDRTQVARTFAQLNHLASPRIFHYPIFYCLSTTGTSVRLLNNTVQRHSECIGSVALQAEFSPSQSSKIN